jgi:hypothetical protein
MPWWAAVAVWAALAKGLAGPATQQLAPAAYYELRDLDRREQLARQELRVVELERERLARSVCGGAMDGCTIDLERRVVIRRMGGR